jgi:hypothetical protein
LYTRRLAAGFHLPLPFRAWLDAVALTANRLHPKVSIGDRLVRPTIATENRRIEGSNNPLKVYVPLVPLSFEAPADRAMCSPCSRPIIADLPDTAL